MALMEMPEEQVSIVASLGQFGGWPMAAIVFVIWGTFIVYLLALRRHFRPTLVAND
jgi:hypothetical protein